MVIDCVVKSHCWDCGVPLSVAKSLYEWPRLGTTLLPVRSSVESIVIAVEAMCSDAESVLSIIVLYWTV